MEEYRRWVRNRIAENAQSDALNTRNTGAISGIGQLRGIGDANDPRLTIGGTPQPTQIPGLPDPGVGEARLAAYLAENQPFKADPSLVGGIGRASVHPYHVRSAQSPLLRLAATVDLNRRPPIRAEDLGIWDVSRNNAPESVLIDGNLATERRGEAGLWRPTSEKDAQMLENQAARTQGIYPGTRGGVRRADAPPQRRPGKVTAEEIDQVMDRLSELGVVDVEQDPRFQEMEQAALDVNRFPRRQPYEGDPSEIGERGQNKTWGGIMPSGAIDVLTPLRRAPRPGEEKGLVVLNGQPYQYVKVYPGDATGQKRTLNPDATALWEREEDLNLANVLAGVEEDLRTPSITGLGLEQLARKGRYRDASEAELALYQPERGENSLKGFMVTAGTQPMTHDQLIQEVGRGKLRAFVRKEDPVLSNPVALRRVLRDQAGGDINVLIDQGDGQLVRVAPEQTSEILNGLVQRAIDPADTAITLADTPNRMGLRRILAASGEEASVPALHVQMPNGELGRIVVSVPQAGEPQPMIQVLQKREEPLVPLSAQDLAAGFGRLRDAALDPSNRSVVLGQGGRFTADSQLPELFLMRPGQSSAEMTRLGLGFDPQGGNVLVREWSPVYDPRITTEAQLAKRNSLGDPYVAKKETPVYRIGRPIKMAYGVKDELRQAIPGGLADIALLDSRGRIGRAARGADPSQDLFEFLNQARSFGFSQEAPIASTQQVMREQMAGLIRSGMSPSDAARTIGQVIAEKSRTRTEYEDYTKALQSVWYEAAGVERRIGGPTQSGKLMGDVVRDASPAGILELARALKQAQPSRRVIPEGDVRLNPEFQPRRPVTMNYGDDAAWEDDLNLTDEQRDQRLAVADYAGYRNDGRAIERAPEDLDSDAYMSDKIGTMPDEGMPGESPRVVEEARPSPELRDEVAALVYRELLNSPLAQGRTRSEGVIQDQLKWQAKMIADAAVRAGGRSERQFVMPSLSPSVRDDGSRGVRRDPMVGVVPPATREQVIARALEMASPPIENEVIEPAPRKSWKALEDELRRRGLA